jgi:hypothetical protein
MPGFFQGLFTNLVQHPCPVLRKDIGMSQIRIIAVCVAIVLFAVLVGAQLSSDGSFAETIVGLLHPNDGGVDRLSVGGGDTKHQSADAEADEADDEADDSGDVADEADDSGSDDNARVANSGGDDEDGPEEIVRPDQLTPGENPGAPGK